MTEDCERIFGRTEEFSVGIAWHEHQSPKLQYVRLSVSVGGVCVKGDDWIDIRDLAQTMKPVVGYADYRECCELFSGDPTLVVDRLDEAQMSDIPLVLNGASIDDFARFNLLLHPALRGCSIWALSCAGRSKVLLKRDKQQTVCAEFSNTDLSNTLLRAYQWCDDIAYN